MNSNRALRAASVLAGLGIALAAAPAFAQAEPVTPVPRLEAERYLGDWRQLAAIPQPFNLVCARDTRANYSLTPNGDIAVRNSCTTWWGGGNEIAGVAKVTDPATQAQLAVSFRDESNPRTNYVVTRLIRTTRGPSWSIRSARPVSCSRARPRSAPANGPMSERPSRRQAWTPACSSLHPPPAAPRTSRRCARADPFSAAVPPPR